jgi:PAS domain S-box-containing protein
MSLNASILEFARGFKQFPGVAFAFNKQGVVLESYGEVESVLGVSKGEIEGSKIDDQYFFPEQRLLWWENFQKVAETERVRSFECYWVSNSGNCPLFHWSLMPFQDGVFAFLVDNTQHHDHQVDTFMMEQVIELLKNHFPVGGVLLFDTQLKPLFMGGQGRKELGFTENPEIDNILKALPAVLAKMVEERLTHVFKGMSFVFEWTLQGIDQEVQLKPIFSASRRVIGGILFATNITTQKEIQRRFQSAKDRYQILFESNPHAMWIYDAKSFHVLGANTAAIRQYGFSREDFLGMSLLDLHPQKDREEIRKVLGTDQELFTISGTWIHLTSKMDPIHVQLSTHEYDLLDQDVRLLLAIDVTKQYQVEQALLMSEQRFRSLVQNSYDVITILDVEGVIRFASPACEKILGYAVEEMEDQQIFEYFHPEDLSRVRETFENLIKDPHSKETVEYRFKRSDGEWVYIESIGINLMENPSVQGIVVNSRDVSDRRQLTDQLRQSQKMESIGRLAGGIAHDFNNILTAIQGYADLALLGDDQDSLKDYLQQISIAANRAASLTNQLLAFSRQQVIQLKLVDVNQVIAEMTMMLMRLLGEGIHFKVDCDPDLPMVEGDKGMIEQILMNLVVNARDAMKNGGVLTIRTSASVHPALKNFGSPRRTRENAICIEVEDTGCGMDQRTKEHIFEPFFTTKEIGKGTGLGLSTVYGIVAQHHGNIEVDSEIDRGTIFKIFLPISEKVPVRAVVEGVTEGQTKGNNELILVVEDETAVRAMMVAVLKRQGYRTIEASSAAQALVMWSHQKNDIRLVLSDIMMPGGMSGCEMAKRIQSQDPTTKVVFCSGYSPRLVSDGTILDPGLNFIQKPFSPNDLAKIIRKSLNQT